MNVPATANTALMNGQARGAEALDNSVLEMPRVCLLQSKSPEVEEKPREFIAGDIINNLTKEKLGESFIPIFAFINWLKFNPRNVADPAYDASYGAGDLIWKIDDPLDPRTKEAEFGPNGEKPVAMKVINFVCYFPPIKMPLVLSFSKTSFKAGRQLSSMVKFAGVDAFARQYKLGAKLEKGTAGSYYVYTVSPNGMTAPEDFTFAEGLYKALSGRVKDIVVDHDAPIEEKRPY